MNKNVNPAGPVALLALVVLACAYPPEETPGLADATALVDRVAAPAPVAMPAGVATPQLVYFAPTAKPRSRREGARPESLGASQASR